MIHHGLESQPRQGVKGGVAIILSAELEEAWKWSGMKVWRGGITIGKATRLVMIDLNAKTLVKAKTKTHFKHNTIILISSFHL